MAETIDIATGRVVFLKDKYSRPKDKGRYKGGTSAGGKVRTKRKKTGGGPSSVEFVKVIAKDGKIRWDTRPRQTRR